MEIYPRISIITPSFNQGKFLEQTILSVINQGYPNLEYIIIDGGSTDGSVEIIKRYSRNIAYWISEKDNGQSAAINKGLTRATGEIVNWINSDDYYEPKALFKVAEGFRNPEVNIVSGKGRLFKDDVTVGYTKGVDIYEGNLAKSIGWVRMDQPETFFRKKVIEEIGPLDERLHYLMDRDWWLKYLLIFGLKGVYQAGDVLVNFRLHEDSKTVTNKSNFEIDHNSFFYSLAAKNGFPEIAQFISDTSKIHKDFYSNIQAKLSREIFKRIFSYYFLLRGNMFYEAGNKRQAESFYGMVDTMDLEKEDRVLFRKMKFRNKLPVQVINILRKLTR